MTTLSQILSVTNGNTMVRLINGDNAKFREYVEGRCSDFFTDRRAFLQGHFIERVSLDINNDGIPFFCLWYTAKGI